MPDFEQITDHFGSQLETARRERESRFRREQNAMAIAASGVMGDPNWKMFADHIEGMKQRFVNVIEGQKKALTGATLLEPHQYAQIKADQRYAEGYVQAAGEVIQLIKTLVDNQAPSA